MSADVVFTVDGLEQTVLDGTTLTAALVQRGFRTLRRNPVSGDQRGAFCGMGACYECELVVDGVTVRACLTAVCAGMSVATEQDS